MVSYASEQRNRRIVELTETGVGRTAIARRLGLTKNVVIGVIQRHAPHLVVRHDDTGLAVEGVPFSRGMSREEMRERRDAIAAERIEIAEINADVRAFARIDDGRPIRTLDDRLDALRDRMDAVLAETRGSGNYLTVPLRPLRPW